MTFYKNIIKQVTGNENSSAQVFTSNNFVIPNYPNIKPFCYSVPMYGSTGGTTQYYDQDPYSVFTSLSKPFIKFEFTGNTFSLSGDTVIIHEVFKLRYDTYKAYNIIFERDLEYKEEEITSQTETETTTENGITTTKTTVRDLSSNKNLTNFSKDGSDALDELTYELENPISVFSATTSGITSFFYDFEPVNTIKARSSSNENEMLMTENLFDDRSQYFIKTYFRFSKETLDGYFDQNIISHDFFNSGVTITAHTDHPQYLYSEVTPHQITASTFNQFLVTGKYFSYFDIPNKPKIEPGSANGNLPTFSPRVIFSNVEDGDEYSLDINYDLLDTGFTTNIFTNKIQKNLTASGTQEYSTSLKHDTEFSYRIGNIKKLKNIFGVEQSVITYSDVWTAKTQPDPVTIYVFSTSDSPYTSELPTQTTPPNITVPPPETLYSLSGYVSGSVVTGATVFLTVPNGNTLNKITDLTGNYLFTGLTVGNYIISTEYRGYQTKEIPFILTGDTSVAYQLILLWGNDYDTWGNYEDVPFGEYE